MKKVLYVATVDSHIKAFHLPYLKLLHDHGYMVHVATNGSESFPYCDVKHQISIERSPLSIRNLKAIRQLKKIIEEEKFDLVSCHTPMGSVVTRLAAKRARKKYNTRVIYTAHGFHFYKGAPKKNWLIFYPVEKYLAKYTDTLVTINKEDYDLAKRKFSKRCKNIKYIPGVGVDEKKFQISLSEKNKKKLKKSLNLKDEDYILTCVARLDANKNQGFLIDVMEKIVKKCNNAHLLLAGEDELNGYYQKAVSEKKLNKNVHFLGNRSDVPQLLSISDIILSASKREGLPVNVMEAFAVGKPVVALECRGMKDLIENGKNGFIIKQNENDLFMDSILEIKNDLALNNKICSNNLAKIEMFKIDSIIKQYEKIFFKK